MQKKLALFLAIISVVLFSIVVYRQRSIHSPSPAIPVEQAQAEEQDRVEHIPIATGDTFSVLAERAGISPTETHELLAATADVYDLAEIRAGKELLFYFDSESGEFLKLVYEPNTEEAVTIFSRDDTWVAKRAPIEYEIRQKTIRGTIESSLYETALEAGFDERAIIDLAEIFAWQIDFAIDIRSGDSFTAILEERYRDGKYVMPGQILAAKFENAGTPYEGFYYVENEEHHGYFDREGNSLQKIFLKSPLQYRYISSTFGIRIDPISHRTSMHTGIDYAAPYGTPAVTVGDGVVVRAGWFGGYGNAVDVRHNETYTTRYGHFSKLAVSVGDRVSQGDIVGYVGSTGWSTGPHLHYEMIKNGTQVNAFTVEIPSGEALAPESMQAFSEHISQFQL